MTKPLETRLKEVVTLYQRLQDLGLSQEVCPGISKFKHICNVFVKDGQGSSGTIKLPEAGRNLVYILSMQDHVTSHVTLSKMN